MMSSGLTGNCLAKGSGLLERELLVELLDDRLPEL